MVHNVFDGLTTSNEWVTPTKAADWLKKSSHFKNRPVKPSRVKRYAVPMADGDWMVNGETIVFGADGVLYDGQHRLMACVQTGCSFPTIVVRGVDPRAFSSMGGGFARTGGDVLATVGATNYNITAAAIGLLHEWKVNHCAGGAQRGDNQTIMRMFRQNPGIVDSVNFACECKNVTGRISILAFCHFVCAAANRTEADAFFGALATGENIRRGDPVYALRERLLALSAESRAGKHLRHSSLIYLILRAFRAHATGEEMARVSLPKSGVGRESLKAVDPENLRDGA